MPKNKLSTYVGTKGKSIEPYISSEKGNEKQNRAEIIKCG